MPNTCRPRRAVGRNDPSGADDHGQGLLVERVRTEDVHPVPDERHPGAAFQEEPLRSPGPELRHGIDVRGADVSLRGVDRHPVHFGADVHARIHTISDIDQHGTGVAVREILLAGLTIAPQRRERATGHEPHLRGAAGRLARRCLRGCLGERHGRGKREQAKAAHPGARSRGSRQPPREVGAHLRVVVVDARARRRPGRTSVDRSTRR